MKRLEVAHLQAAAGLKSMKHQELLGCSFSKNKRSGVVLDQSRKYQEFLILQERSGGAHLLMLQA
jgi:hypothetical protein